MKILLIKFRAIGDVLLSTPLVENLNRIYPDAKIDFVINKESKDILLDNPNINDLFTYDRSKIKEKNIFLQIVDELKFIFGFFFKKYDIVMNLTEGDRGSIISWFADAPKKIGYKPRNKILKKLNIFSDTIKEDHSMHIIKQNLRFLEFINEKPLSTSTKLFFKNSDKTKIDKLLKEKNIKDFIHIHPTARWFSKCWKDEHWAEVIDYLQKEKKIKVILTAAPNENEMKKISNILFHSKTKPLDLSGKITLKELAYLSNLSKLYLGADTAPMHMACALNVPAVALFGKTNPLQWGPWDNEKSFDDEFANDKKTQKFGKNMIIQKNNDTIYFDEEGNKYNRGLMSITADEVIKTLEDNYGDIF